MAIIQNIKNGFRILLAQDGVIHIKPLLYVEELDDLEH